MLKKYIHTLSSRLQPHLKIENVFILIFLFFGSAFIMITPPGQNPDEQAHFDRAWQLADFNLKSDVIEKNGEKLVGGYLPTSIGLFFEANNIEDGVDVNHKFNDLDHAQINNIRVNRTLEFRDFRGSALYSPVAYVPSIPAIWTGKLLNLPIVATFYMVRITGLLSVAALLYLAIRIIPIGKWGILVVCLIPSLVAQSGAISADGAVVGLCIIFISYTLRLALQRKKLSLTSLALLSVLICAIGLTKITYLPLVLLLFLIPLLNDKQRNIKSWLSIGIVTLVALVPPLLWMSGTSYIDTQNGPGSNLILQKAYVLDHPLSYVKVIYNTFLTEQNTGSTPFVWLGAFGNFGFLTAPLPTAFVFMSLFSLLLSTFVRSPREVSWKYNTKTLLSYRAIMLSTAVAIIGAISTALYLYYSALRSSTISGLQGRYFLPVMPLLLLSFYGSNTLVHQRKVKYYIIISAIIVLMAGLMAAFHRYYATVTLVLA